MYSTSRIQAGSHWSGDLFKCQLMPVSQAIRQGIYVDVNMTDYQSDLEQIFPTGVCDYQQGDVGRPHDI